MKRNLQISYLKGWSITAIFLIHLIDWSNLSLTPFEQQLKEFLYPSVVMFIVLAGTVIPIAYAKKDLMTAARRLWARGLQLIGIYYLYSVLKVLIFNFEAEPFYSRFQESGTLNAAGVLTLQSFSVPMGIIYTIGLYLLLAPALLWVTRRINHKMVTLGVLTVFVVLLSQFQLLPLGWLSNLVLGRNLAIFPPLHWLAPFLIGMIIGFMGIDSHRTKVLFLFGVPTILYIAYSIVAGNGMWHISSYPFTVYYLFVSLSVMYALMFLFEWLESRSLRVVDRLLALLALLGDNSLWLYILQWLVIDLTLCVFLGQWKAIWLTVPLMTAAYVYWKRNDYRRLLDAVSEG